MMMDFSRNAWLTRLAQAKRGQWIMYHVGYLYTDRTKNKKLAALANEVYARYLAGDVLPVQRRLGLGQYEYFAVVRRAR